MIATLCTEVCNAAGCGNQPHARLAERLGGAAAAVDAVAVCAAHHFKRVAAHPSAACQVAG